VSGHGASRTVAAGERRAQRLRVHEHAGHVERALPARERHRLALAILERQHRADQHRTAAEARRQLVVAALGLPSAAHGMQRHVVVAFAERVLDQPALGRRAKHARHLAGQRRHGAAADVQRLVEAADAAVVVLRQHGEARASGGGEQRRVHRPRRAVVAHGEAEHHRRDLAQREHPGDQRLVGAGHERVVRAVGQHEVEPDRSRLRARERGERGAERAMRQARAARRAPRAMPRRAR
jgi:hypothetical protein